MGKCDKSRTYLEKAEVNEYKITLDLYEGDQFQFAINSEWENQRGFEYLDTTTKDGSILQMQVL